MRQSHKDSVIEAVVNVGSGVIVAYCVTQFILAPALHLDITYSKNFVITTVLTVVSMIRSYLWRRFFDSKNRSRK